MPENDASGITNSCHSAAGLNGRTAGMLPSLDANTITRSSPPSPRAQKTSSLNLDRLTGVIGVAAGKNIAPAHGNGAPALIVPFTSSALREPLAPPEITVISAVDFPPIMPSVEICQSLPNSARGAPDSKSLTTPVFVGASGAAVSGGAFGLSTRTPRFQIATMSRVAVMSRVGSPATEEKIGSQSRGDAASVTKPERPCRNG